MPVGAAPFIAAGAGIATDALNNLFSAGMSRRQNKRMVDFWRMNNEYNHPSAQMARLREAGLNPNLIYGQGAAGATGRSEGIGTPDKPEMRFNNPLEQFQNTKIQNLQADNLRKLNNKIGKETELISARTITEAFNSDIKGVDAKKAKATLNNIISQIQSETDIKGYEAANAFGEMQAQAFTPEQLKTIRESRLTGIVAKALQAGHDAKNAEKLGILRDAEIQLKNANMEFFKTNAILNIIGKILGFQTTFK